LIVSRFIQGCGWIGIALGGILLTGDAVTAATKADLPIWFPDAGLLVGSLIVVGIGMAVERIVLIESHLRPVPSGPAKN
jgi:hypothetical protein